MTSAIPTVGKTTLRSNVVSDVKTLSGTFCEYNFPLAICLKQKRTPMNGMNERTLESHECKRQLHLQKQCEQSWARLACETKEQRQRKLQPRRKARKRREQSRRTEETSKIGRVSRKPATSFSETTSAKTTKAWNVRWWIQDFVKEGGRRGGG